MGVNTVERWNPDNLTGQNYIKERCLQFLYFTDDHYELISMKNIFASWQIWAVLSAIFAALTAIFAKVGIRDINSDFATFIRTIIILFVLAFILTATGQFQPLSTISPKALTFLVLSGIATGASWMCYFRALKIGDASKVAPVDKFSVVLVAIFSLIFLGERISLIHWLGIFLIAGGAVVLAVF